MDGSLRTHTSTRRFSSPLSAPSVINATMDQNDRTLPEAAAAQVDSQLRADSSADEAGNDTEAKGLKSEDTQSSSDGDDGDDEGSAAVEHSTANDTSANEQCDEDMKNTGEKVVPQTYDHHES